MNGEFLHDQAMQQIADNQDIEILDTCRIFQDIDKHPLPERNCKIDVKLSCGSTLVECHRKFWREPCKIGVVHFGGINIEHMDKIITQWRLSK